MSFTMKRIARHFQSLLLRAAGALVLVNLLFTLAMAASPELHREYHHDADHQDHECVVTHMLHGDFGDGVPLAAITVAPVVLPMVEIIATHHRVWVSPLWLTNGVLEHAPPALAWMIHEPSAANAAKPMTAALGLF